MNNANHATHTTYKLSTHCHDLQYCIKLVENMQWRSTSNKTNILLTCHRYAGLLVLQVLISFGFLRLYLGGRGIWHTGEGRGWTRAGLCGYSCALRWARELRFRLLLANIYLFPFLLLLPHLLALLSFTFNQRHSVFDRLGHGFMITFTDVARFYLYREERGVDILI